MSEEIVAEALEAEGCKPVRITACLEALQYDAAFHRDRGLTPPIPPPPRIVPKDRFVRALWQRFRTNVWGGVLVTTTFLFLALLVQSAIQDTQDYIADQPVSHTEYPSRPDGPLFDETYKPPFRKPLPDAWEEKTMLKFAGMLAVIFICGPLGLACFRRAKTIEVGVPLTRANTAHLPIPETLVRASQPPVFAAQTALLRAVTDRPTTPPEQLARPAERPADMQNNRHG